MNKLILTFLALLICANARSHGTDPVLNEHQKEIIHYFKEIALGFEYGSASGITRKWNARMKIFVDGNPSQPVFDELQRVIGELNTLITDGFQIDIVSKKEESNFHMFFGSKDDFVKMYPADAPTVNNSSGIFRIFWNRNNFITRGYIFIHDQTSEKEQKHAVREELTQSLGLGKDSPLYPQSIFQSAWTLPTEFLPIDKEMIRYLYHPVMRVGLQAPEVERLLTDLLIAEISSL
jgi:hypothetical protein